MSDFEQQFGFPTADEAYVASLDSFLESSSDKTNHQLDAYMAMHQLKMDEDGLMDSIHPCAFAATAAADDTPTVFEAMNGPEADGFYKAMEKEFIMLNDTMDA